MIQNSIRISLILLTALFFGKISNAQISVTPADTALCPGDTLTMTASFTSQFDNITTDDVFGNLLEIGFPFTFYGEEFTQVVISANNFLSFVPAHANGGSSYVYTTAVNNGQLNRAIMFPYQDINMGITNPGWINYQSFGNAPNRVFVVEFCDTKPFSCSSSVLPSQYETNQAVLYENGGIIEMFIKNHTPCSAWQNATAIQGLRFDGQQDLVPGRDIINTAWSATEDGRRFTPNPAGGYTIEEIAYDPIPLLSDVDINDVLWYEEGNPNPIGQGESVTVVVQPGVSFYQAELSDEPCMFDSIATLTGKTIIHDATAYDTTRAEICFGETFEFRGQVFDQTINYQEVEVNTDGCDIVYRLELTVHPQPVAEWLNPAYEQGVYYCKGSSTNLILKYALPGQEYHWYRNDQVLSNNTHILNLNQEGEYYCIITTEFGCSDTTSVITVWEESVDMDFDVEFLFGCVGDNIQIQNNSDYGTYAWNFGEGVQVPDTNRNPTYYYMYPGEYEVTLVMTNDMGCTDSLSKFIDTRRVFEVSFVPSEDSICQVDLEYIIFTNTSEGDIASYHWDLGDGNTSAATNPIHTYQNAGEYEVVLTATDSYGCEQSYTHTILIDSFPVLELYTEPLRICEGQAVNLVLDGVTPTSDLTWSFGDGIVWDDEASASGIASHSYLTPGTYIVRVNSKPLVCPEEELTDTIRVGEMPIVKLAEDTLLCIDGDGIPLSNISGRNYPAATYLWSTGSTDQQIMVTEPGTYVLEIDNNGCIGAESVVVDKDCYVNIPNAFTPNGDGDNEYFFPRELLSEGVTGFHMEIFNRWGQIVFETDNVNGRGWDGKFNDKEQPTGVYVYRIVTVYKNGRTEEYTGNVTLLR